MEEDKPSLEGYALWFQRNFNISLDSTPSVVYDFVIPKLQGDIEDSSFWKELLKNLQEYNDEYFLSHEYPLMKLDSPPVLVSKSYESLINKTYRKNILN